MLTRDDTANIQSDDDEEYRIRRLVKHLLLALFNTLRISKQKLNFFSTRKQLQKFGGTKCLLSTYQSAGCLSHQFDTHASSKNGN